MGLAEVRLDHSSSGELSSLPAKAFCRSSVPSICELGPALPAPSPSLSFLTHPSLSPTMAASNTTKDTKAAEEPSVVQKIVRAIPGLKPSSDSTSGAPLGKKRSRKAKTSSISAPVAGTAVGHGSDGDKTPLAHGDESKASAVIDEQDEEEEQIEAKKTSAVEATSKRIRAANKKLVSPVPCALPCSFQALAGAEDTRALAGWRGSQKVGGRKGAIEGRSTVLDAPPRPPSLPVDSPTSLRPEMQ